MNKNINPIKNEQGSVLVIALVILVLLTLMGISVTTTSDIDIQIAKNEQEYVNEFYVADSAWRHAIQWLDGIASAPALTNQALFISGATGDPNFLSIRNFGNATGPVYVNNVQSVSPDGTLGGGSSQINYWYRITYLDELSMEGTIAPLFGEEFRRYSFIITSVAREAGNPTAGAQVVTVTVTRVLQSGE